MDVDLRLSARERKMCLTTYRAARQSRRTLIMLQLDQGRSYREINAATLARTLLQGSITWLRKLSPAAAASLEEGWEETLTVVRLGVPELLRKTLATTNPIESAFSGAESVTRRVNRWRDGTMRERWCVAGLLDAESRFRRVKGHKHLKELFNALEQVAHSTLDAERKRA